MDQYTGSISRGRVAPNHNLRLDHKGQALEDNPKRPKHIDYSRSAKNIVLENTPLAKVYEDKFGAALEKYNAKQVDKGHPERQIENYLDKVTADKKLNPAYEFVVQVGNKDEHPPATEAVEIYKAFDKEFQREFGDNFAVTQAVIHLDEQVAHMHYTVVPVAESKRGLSVQNSMNKAMAQAGYGNYKEMLLGWDKILTEQMQERGLERVAGDHERQLGGVDIETYKRSMDMRQEIEQERSAANAELAETKQQTQAAQIKQAKANIAAAQAEQRAQQATEQAKAELGQLQQATDVAKGELAQAQQETQAELERSECLRRDNATAEQRVGELQEQVQQAREHAIAPADPGDDRQETGQEQQAQEQQGRMAEEQGRGLGEQGAGLVRELAEAAQRAGQGEDADPRGLEELRSARDAAQERVAGLEQRRDAAQGRIEDLKGAHERATQKDAQARSQEQAAEGRLQQARERLQDARDRIDGARERLVERLGQLKQSLGLDHAREVWQAVKEHVGLGNRDMGDAASRIDATMAPQHQQEPEQQQEWTARDWDRYEMDRSR